LGLTLSVVFLQDGRGWLVADVDIQCFTREHDDAMMLARVAIALYPMGIFLLNAVLLVKSRVAITSGRHDTLSRTIGFLYKE
jgi:hypothetical protein